MKSRLKSLDVWRGMTVFFMIVVNTTGNWGATYTPLLHAKWHGFTPTDLVFPSFLFVVGSSLYLVQKKWQSKTKAEVYLKIFKRSVLIFGIGFMLYWFPFFNLNLDGTTEIKPYNQTRIFGVLQRIGLVFLIASLVVYNLSYKNVLLTSIAILVGYWGIMIGFGDLTMTGNAAHKLDMYLFGADRLYGGEGVPFDPEGLLSTMPAVVNALLGFLITKRMVEARGNAEALQRVIWFSFTLLLLGYLWHFGFPINKKIWTSSFVLLTSGVCGLLLLLLHRHIDRDEGKGVVYTFFGPMGKNPLFIYLLSGLLAKMMWWFPHEKFGSYYQATYEYLFRWMGDYFGALMFALAFTMICWLVALWMDRRKLYIRI